MNNNYYKKTNVKSTSRKYYEKYYKTNIVNPVELGFNGVLVVYPKKAGEKERLEKELNEEKSEADDLFDEPEHKVKFELNLPSLDY